MRRRLIPLLVAVAVSLVGFPRLAVAADETPTSEEAPAMSENRFAPSSTTW